MDGDQDSKGDGDRGNKHGSCRVRSRLRDALLGDRYRRQPEQRSGGTARGTRMGLQGDRTGGFVSGFEEADIEHLSPLLFFTLVGYPLQNEFRVKDALNGLFTVNGFRNESKNRGSVADAC